MSQDSDDLFVVRFGGDFSKHKIRLSYSNNDDDFSKQPRAEFSSTYLINAGTNSLGAAHTSYEVGSKPLESKASLKREQQQYDSAVHWIFKHVLSVKDAKQLQVYLKKHAKSLYQKQEKADKARSHSQRISNRTFKKRFLKATYKPKYTDKQWRAFIKQRAEFLNLSVAKITKSTLSDDESLEYDYDYTSTISVGYYQGAIPNSEGYQSDQYYFMTTQDGQKYLILLPLRLYNQKDLKKWHYYKKMPTFYYLPAPVSYPKLSSMVLANETPSSFVVSNNINVVAKEKE